MIYYTQVYEHRYQYTSETDHPVNEGPQLKTKKAAVHTALQAVIRRNAQAASLICVGNHLLGWLLGRLIRDADTYISITAYRCNVGSVKHGCASNAKQLFLMSTLLFRPARLPEAKSFPSRVIILL